MVVGTNPGWSQMYFTLCRGPDQDDEDVFLARAVVVV